MIKRTEAESIQLITSINTFEWLLNQVREGSLKRAVREVNILNVQLKLTCGDGHCVIGIYEDGTFVTNIQLEETFIKVASKLIPGKIVTYNLIKDNPIMGSVVCDILSEYFPDIVAV